MINAIVYNSKTGSCEHYAKELSRALHVPCHPLDQAPARSDAKVILQKIVNAVSRAAVDNTGNIKVVSVLTHGVAVVAHVVQRFGELLAV